jgi:hypothetical protein
MMMMMMMMMMMTNTHGPGQSPGHLVGGLSLVALIAFLTQNAFFAVASGNPTHSRRDLLFGGGLSALNQLGIERKCLELR